MPCDVRGDLRRPCRRRLEHTQTAGDRRPATPTCPRSSRSAPIADLAEWPYPKNQLVPLTEVVHDRLSVEVFRGCTRGCRFCQAGMITRPVRERPAEQVRTMIQDGLRPHWLRRSGLDLAVNRRLQWHHRGRQGHDRRRVHGMRETSRSRYRACASTRSPSALLPSCSAADVPASRLPPRRARGACARSSTN